MKFYIYETDKERNPVVGNILVEDREIVGLNEAYDKVVWDNSEVKPMLIYYPDDYVDTDFEYNNYQLYDETYFELYNKIYSEFNYEDYDNIKVKNFDIPHYVEIYNLIAYSFAEYFKRNNTTDVITIDLELKPRPRITNMINTLKIVGRLATIEIDYNWKEKLESKYLEI